MVMWWCVHGDVVVCSWWCGGVFMVMWWCVHGDVVVCSWWCVHGDVVVCSWWCGGCHGGVVEVIFIVV